MCLLTAFVLWTVAIYFVDVRAIGPQGSSVGFAGINGFVHNLTGVHWGLYTITDWLGLVPICVALVFGALGLFQWIKRKSIMLVDRTVLALGAFYAVVMAAYILFELVVINYRPVLIDGRLEASYPSSTTVLVMCVMPVAIVELRFRIKSPAFRWCIGGVIVAFTIFMVMVRLLSGVHWFTDIVGGAILSGALVTLYATVAKRLAPSTL